jgi:hypothetical protein
MLGHNHVPNDNELIAPSDLFQDFEKQIATLRRAQQRLTPITTASDKVQVSGAVVSLETPRHGERID